MPEPGNTIIKASWIIEVCIKRKWMPVGNDNGIIKFPTKKAAEDEQQRLLKKEHKILGTATK